MQYAIVIQNRRADWSDMPPERRQRILSAYFAWIDELTAEDKLVDSEALRHGGRLIEVVDGAIVDGPFTETKEVVGGFFVIEVADEAEALAIARRCPALQFGDSIALRRVSHPVRPEEATH